MGKVLDRTFRQTVLETVPDWILPDHITILRAALLLPLIIYKDVPLAAIGILLLSSLCDTLDGMLARARKQVTRDGAALDAACDKIFLIGALLCVCYDQVHPAFVWGVIGIDAAIGVVRWLKRRKNASLNSNPWGKRKTITLSIAIGLVLTGVDVLVTSSIFAFVVALFCAVMSFVGHARELRSALPA